MILPVGLYGCEILSLTLRKELRVSENRALRRIFGSKRDEVTGGWRKLHNEELDNLYHSQIYIIRMMKSKRMRSAEHVEQMGETRNAYRILTGKPEGKRPLGGLKFRPVDNIKMDLREIGWSGTRRLPGVRFYWFRKKKL
jgi:hypothetical protein